MIKEIKPTTTAEQNDSSSPSASKAQEQLTDEEIHIKQIEQAFHDAEYDEADEEFDIEW